jgi:hypothetical protein
MATERQIIANRRNGRNSTGPRSGAGKARASHNSYRHGLSAKIALGADRAKRIEQLARQFAGGTADGLALELARAAAHAAFDVADARQAKLALLERLQADGNRDGPVSALTALHADGRPEAFEAARIFAKLDQPNFFIDGWPQARIFAKPDGFFTAPRKAGTTKPSARPKRSDQAVGQGLSELRKLDRYERRAIVRRQRSLRALSKRKSM